MLKRFHRKNEAAVVLGHAGGLKSGAARMLKLSAEQRSGIAREAATARWHRRLWETTHPNPDVVAELFETLRRLLPARAAVIGAYAYGTIVEPRETHDIDILMARRSAVALAKKLAALHPGVTWKERSNVIEVRLRGAKVIDFPPDEHPLMKAILDGPLVKRMVPRFGRAPVPSVEELIATKYLATVSPYRRREKKLQDVVDALNYWTKYRRRIDRAKLDALLGLIGPNAAKTFWESIGVHERGERGVW